MENTEKDNPISEGLPPEVKQEFEQNKLDLEARDARYVTSLANKNRNGAAWGFAVGLLMSLLMGKPLIPFLFILPPLTGAAGYAIFRLKTGHFRSIGIYFGTMIFVTFFCAIVGIIGLNFFYFLLCMGLSITTGGMLGVKARDMLGTEMPFDRKEHEKDKKKVPDLGPQRDDKDMKPF